MLHSEVHITRPQELATAGILGLHLRHLLDYEILNVERSASAGTELADQTTSAQKLLRLLRCLFCPVYASGSSSVAEDGDVPS